ncbi:MAG TPA: nucleoside triphosphate pyrophosphatase [Rhizomicrobium sp.]|nr:nucleoside triphosphate pyrophosphatase [Rhizomicrobium sp.]
MTSLVLASGSPARARLLTAAGLVFEIVPADVDETALKRESAARNHNPAATACSLAAAKAGSVAQLHPDAIVLGADQLLSLDGEIISKCQDANQASSLLRRLRGRTHELVTAAVLARNGIRLWDHVDICRMTMRRFSELFLEDYLSRAGAALVQSVGCYEFEGLGAQLFEHVEGDFFSVLGLPLLPVLGALREYGAIPQ